VERTPATVEHHFPDRYRYFTWEKEKKENPADGNGETFELKTHVASTPQKEAGAHPQQLSKKANMLCSG
jgi:hypothetical protein